MTGDLKNMDYFEFRDMLDDKKIYDELSFMLLEKLQTKSKYDSAKKYANFNQLREDVLYVLKLVDVATFQKLLADELTLKQAKARLDGIQKNFHYVTLDDLIDKLGTDVGESNDGEKNRDRCQRSLAIFNS